MKKKRDEKTLYLRAAIVAACVILSVLIIIFIGQAILNQNGTKKETGEISENLPSYVDVQLIDVDGHARRGVKLDSDVHDIVIHYVGNPKTTAQNNRDYFNNKGTTVSSHFVVGLEGEVILCVPLDEKSSASNDRNGDTISIEVCHEDETGKFNDATYEALVQLTTWLCERYDLTTDHIIRHYDITGKKCPLYFVEHEDAWEAFKSDVERKMN